MDQPDLILKPLAEDSATKVLPPVTAAEAGFGRMSQESGFPPETQEPLETGGKAPDRNDMNGALNLLSQHTVFQQTGGRYKFNPALTYDIGHRIVLDDGITEVMSITDGNTDNPNTDLTPNWRESSVDASQLGTAAYLDAQTSLTDMTLNRLMKVGAFGLGGTGISLPAGTDLNTVRTAGFYRLEGEPDNGPSGVINSVMIVGNGRDVTLQLIVQFNTGVTFTRGGSGSGSTWSAWKTHWDSGSLIKQANSTDATAGRVLLNGAFGLGGKAPSFPDPAGDDSGIDFNVITVGGTYTYTVDTKNRPMLLGASGVGVMTHIERVFDNRAFQEAREDNGKLFYRFRFGNPDTGNWGDWQYLWDSSNFDPDAYQTLLGFTPVQQGTGTGQLTNAVKIGWTALDACNVTVDDYDLGAMWTDNIGVEKVRAAIARFAVGEVGTYGLFRAYNGAGLVPGSWTAGINLQYTDAEATSAHGSPAGTWQLMGGLFNADGQTSDSVSVWLRVV